MKRVLTYTDKESEQRKTNFFRLFALFAFLALTAPIAGGQDLSWLAGQVKNGNTEAKRDALFRLRDLRNQEASRAATAALNDRDEIVRATAAGSVVFLPPLEAAGALVPLLRDKSPFVRKEAAYALGTVGEASATPALIALLSDADIEVRAAAVSALGAIGDVAALEPLSALLRRPPTEESEFVRRSAARSIGQIAEFVITGRHVVVIPQNFLPQEYKTILPADAKQLSRFGETGALLLRVFLNTSESGDTRRESAFALGALRYRPASSALTAEINSDDRALAEICKEALLKLAAVE